MQIPSFNAMVAQSIKDHWDMASMSDYGDYTYQYKDVARVIEKMHILYEQCGLKKGDRIALCGRNSARWGAAFFSILTYGAVAVPILNEFHPTQIQDIVNHSESRLLFVTDQIFATLRFDSMPSLEGVISFGDYKLLDKEEDNPLTLIYRTNYYIKMILGFIAPSTFGSYSTFGYAAPAIPLIIL